LQKQLAALDRDIWVLGKANEFAYAGLANTVSIGKSSMIVPPPDASKQDQHKTANQDTSINKIAAYRAEVHSCTL
jgi:hypothetical protein